jgi:predicted RNase H-like nuclease (RuvC/YqgF family)
MDSSVVGAIVAGFGALILFMLNKIFENNKKHEGEDRREPDQSLLVVYAELLHITTTVTKIDGGMAELIRRLPHNTGHSEKTRDEIEELRQEFQGFRLDLNKEITSLSEKMNNITKEN